MSLFVSILFAHLNIINIKARTNIIYNNTYIQPSLISSDISTFAEPNGQVLEETMEEWDVLSFGLSIAGQNPSNRWNAAAKLLAFRSLYGIEPDTAIDILNDIQNMDNEHRIQNPQVIMFFVTLHWLRVYDVGSSILFTFGIGSKVTVRKYIRIYLKALQALCHEKVRLSRMLH